MTPESATYPGYRFPAEVIRHTVRLHPVFGLSLREVGLILAERGIGVTHKSVRQWCPKSGADFARRLRRRRPRPGDTWHLNNVFLRHNGVVHHLRRVMDQRGIVLDILVQGRPNATAARRFIKRLPASGSSRDGSLPMGCAAKASLGARSCPTCGTSPAGT